MTAMSMQRELLRRRLECAYAIARSLNSFESVEASMPVLLSIANRALPFFTAALIEGRKGQLRMFVWHGEQAGPADLLRAETNARAAYSFLTGPVPDPSAAMDVVRAPLPLPLARRPAALAAAAGPPARNFITLPLVTPGNAIFGAFQVEGARALDEDDLDFVDALVHQIAVTIDRSYAWQEKRRDRLALGTLSSIE